MAVWFVIIIMTTISVVVAINKDNILKNK